MLDAGLLKDMLCCFLVMGLWGRGWKVWRRGGLVINRLVGVWVFIGCCLGDGQRDGKIDRMGKMGWEDR